MQRHTVTYSLAPGQAADIKLRMLNWSKQFSILLFLDSNGYSNVPGKYECLLATGAAQYISGNESDLLSALQSLHDREKDWVFGHISYDHKNLLEQQLVSSHPESHAFPLLHFFIPQTVCTINREQTLLTIASFDDPAAIYRAIMHGDHLQVAKELPKLQFTQTIGKHDYIDTVNRIREHIAEGDCYELNFCSKGFCTGADVDPFLVFNALNILSPAPFAAYYRLQDQYLLCASPERYLSKEGNRLFSQPIKGTARRDADPVKDSLIKDTLSNDPKERAENVMIVDLVRNDLARSCETGSVQVDELFGMYTFPQVHQMISTVSGTIKAEVPFTDAIRYSFPMGSMTGAPKYKVMQLIDTYEQSARELFSGTVGYITPGGDFDFNVVIRSLFYNAAAQYLSYHTGGAITYDSNAEQEWEEMRLKAWALERIFL